MKQFHGLPSLGVVLYGTKESLCNEAINEKLNDLLMLLGMTLPDSHALSWLADEWLSINDSQKRITEVQDPQQFATSHLALTESNASPIQVTADFQHLEIPQIMQAVTIVDFETALANFMALSAEDELKEQIRLFAFALCSTTLLNRIYDNENLKLSLVWTVLDSVMPREAVEERLPCPKCGSEIIRKRPSGDPQRIAKYVAQLPLNDGDKELMTVFLKKLRNSPRNSFYHAGRLTTAKVKADELIKSLGKKSFTFEEDIRRGEGRFSGIHCLEFLLRRHFFSQLGAVVK